MIGDEIRAFREALARVDADLRFEHLGDRASDALWDFVAAAHFERSADQVKEFVGHHSRPTEMIECYGWVEQLSVDAEFQIGGVRLLPKSTREYPLSEWMNEPSSDYCIAVTSVSGTNPSRMIDRGRQTLIEGLRTVRVGLALFSPFPHKQLRFRLGRAVVLKGHLTSSRHPDDAGFDGTINQQIIDTIEPKLMSSLTKPRNDLDTRLVLASTWLERAILVPEALISLLYSFFALEALLGQRSEGTKASSIAYRQAMLDMAVNGHFSHPDVAWFLYDEVRSVAVHGGDANVSKDDARRFETTVWTAMKNMSIIGHREQLTKSSALLKYLDTHPNRADFAGWVQDHSSVDWGGFFVED